MITFQFFLLIALLSFIKVVSTNNTLPSNEEYLNITDLDEILQALKVHNFEAAEWRDLCLDLGIYIPTLNGIEAANQHHGVDRCLQKCLSSWLSKADKVKQKGGPTWHSLIVGLRNIREINTADGIHRNKHSVEHPACEIFDRYTSDSSIQKNVLSLVNLLYAEKIVKKVLWPKDGRELLQDIGNSICVNYQILEAFGVILQQSPATMSIGGDILKEYKKKFPRKKGVTSSDDENVHFVASSDLNFTKLRGEFADAVFDINQAMIDKPSLKELYQYLRWGYKHLRPHLHDCKNRTCILDLISEHSSLIDISLLESIVYKFNIEKAKPAIQKYKENVNKFQQSFLRHVLNEKFFDRHLLQSEKITFSIDQDVDGFTLEDVEKWIKASFKKHASCIRVHVISESNSFTVTCSFPLLLYEEINLAAMENIEALKEKGLQRLTIGFSTVYDKACEEQLEDDHCSQSIHSGRLGQMVIYSSAKQLNEAHNKEDYTSTNSYLDMVSSVSSWLLILLLLCITTIYVLGLTYQKRETKSTQETSDKTSQAHVQTNIEETEQAHDTNDKDFKRSTSEDAGADAAPHTWRHFKRAPKEVIIIGSFGNHEQWKLPGTIVSPKLIPAGIEGSYKKWIVKEVESIVEIYKKDPENYELNLKDISEKGKSRQFYLDKIKSLFYDCKKDEALIYYTGHGEKDTGNWCFKDGVISFNDIFELYMMHFRGKTLQIVSDCSYSGKWIYDCGKKLDEYGILSCGHHTREQRMLLKIFTSCLPHEEATLLTYSSKGIRYSDVDKGVLIKYDEEIKMEPTQKGQHPMHVDFRHIHCYKMPGDQCELDSTYTWEDRLSKKRERIVFLVDNKHDKFPSWYYLLISEDTFDEFKGKLDQGNIGVEEATKYGKVLYSGPGQNPPSDVKKKLNLRFDMNTYASYKYTDQSGSQRFSISTRSDVLVKMADIC